MDWNLAIEKNREALKRILVSLVAMAGLDTRGQFTFFPREGALHQGSAPAEKSKLSPASTLPRHLHTAVLRLLRPAEAAVRRLVIVAARGIVVPPPPPRSAWSSSPASQGKISSGAVGTTWILPRARGRWTAGGGGGGVVKPRAPRPLALPLFDRLPRWESRPRRPIANSVPRISVPGVTERLPIAPRRLPAPNDPLDATRLGLRFAALASALDDLPRQAKRFARWRATRDAIRAQERNRDAEAAPNRALPRLLMAYRGKPLLASGPSWQAGIQPLSSTDIEGPVGELWLRETTGFVEAAFVCGSGCVEIQVRPSRKWWVSRTGTECTFGYMSTGSAESHHLQAGIT